MDLCKALMIYCVIDEGIYLTNIDLLLFQFTFSSELANTTIDITTLAAATTLLIVQELLITSVHKIQCYNGLILAIFTYELVIYIHINNKLIYQFVCLLLRNLISEKKSHPMFMTLLVAFLRSFIILFISICNKQTNKKISKQHNQSTKNDQKYPS